MRNVYKEERNKFLLPYYFLLRSLCFLPISDPERKARQLFDPAVGG